MIIFNTLNICDNCYVNFFKKCNKLFFRSEVQQEKGKSGWFTSTDSSTVEVDKTSKRISTKKKRVTTTKSVVTTSRSTTTYEEDDDETSASTTAVAIRNEVK